VSELRKSESGMTLIEMLVVASLLIVVLSATLGAFNNFQSTAEVNRRQNDSQDQARNALTLLTRELRNLASPSDEAPNSVERNLAQDLIFRSVGGTRPAGSSNARNVRRVRFCLNPSRRILYRQEQTWTSETAPAMPTAADCPGAGWNTTQRVISANTVNDTRAVFTYNNTILNRITEITTGLFVDVNPGRAPKETSIQSAVFLRNQNRAPTAVIDARHAGGASQVIVLNGSASSDPEGKALTYWWIDTTRTGIAAACDETIPDDLRPQASGCVATGIIANYTAPAPGTRGIQLIVRDNSGLTATSDVVSVCVPGGSVTCSTP
jgi:type II secretory pathway pseudopilin PulG